MSFFKIWGARPLSGNLRVQGAKNSVLPILCACLLAPGRSVIENCPDLADVSATREILERLGCRTDREGHTVSVDAGEARSRAIPPGLMGRMRSSVIFLGALLARFGEAELTYPGGCELGPRPIDLHLRALRALGADIREENGILRARAPGGLRGCRIELPFPSVGATENAMLAASRAAGDTVIAGAAREPEIEDLARFLTGLGARVDGAGGDTITVTGRPRGLAPARYRVMGDRMAAATYLACAAAAGGQVTLDGVEPEHLTAVLDVLEAAGCRIGRSAGRIELISRRRLQAVPPIRTAPYPGFPTDAQAPVMAALATGIGETVVEENLFQSRFCHVPELVRMGADVRLDGRVARVRGRALHGAAVRGADLRGAAALVVAALAADGVSRVSGLGHVDRGYERMEEQLRLLGAEITREN